MRDHSSIREGENYSKPTNSERLGCLPIEILHGVGVDQDVIDKGDSEALTGSKDLRDHVRERRRCVDKTKW
eukprot:3939369-Rhodomonas_salina.3